MLIVASVLVGALIGVASWVLTDDDDVSGSHFRATRTLVFHPPTSGATWAFQHLDELAVLASNGPVPQRVGDELSSSDVAERIVTRSDETTNTLQISVVGGGSDDTTRLANALGDELISDIATQEQARFSTDRDATIARIQTLADELLDLDAQIATTDGAARDLLRAQRQGTLNQYTFTYEQFQRFAAEGAPSERLSSFEPAVAERIGAGDYDAFLDLVASGDNNLRVDQNDLQAELPTGTAWQDGALPRGLLGAFLGLLVGLGAAFVADRLRPRVRTRADAESAYGLPVLAEVPRASSSDGPATVAVSARPRSRAAEAYRAARSQILLQVDEATDRDALVVMVASASPREGRTTTAANLAAAFAEAGPSVLAVDCDLHSPALGEVLGTGSDAGSLTDTRIPGVRYTNIVPDRALSPPRAVAAQRERLDTLRKQFDILVVDTAPIVTTNDTTELVTAADSVVIVAQTSVTTFADAQQARRLLDQLGVRLPGIVLIDPFLRTRDHVDDSTAPSARPSPDGGVSGSRRAGQNGGDAPSEPVVPLRSS
jgi:Mrp family chromosome partitioning ATPase